MGRKTLPGGNLALIEKIEQRFMAKMAEPERIDRIGQILDNLPEIKDPQEVYLYFSRLSEDCLVPILQSLEKMERLEARRLLCDSLVNLGREHLDLFERRLASPKANLVRDMLYIIHKLNPPDKLKIISNLLKHPNLAIRLEALNLLGSSNEESCRPYVMKALFDSDTQMRITAAKLLPNFDLGLAAKTLLSISQDAGFSKRPAAEQRAFYAALIMTGTDNALLYLREQLQSSSVLGKKKLLDQKQYIIEGLALSGSIGAYKFLKSLLEEGISEEALKPIAERACQRLRTKLLGPGGSGHG
jgi:HEAT repeat protein